MTDTSMATVLVVDDEPTNLAAMSAILRGSVQVRVAKGGLKALELAERHPPDLVLLDVDMPDLDGYETCRRLKQLPGNEDLPVVFVTSMRSEEAEARGFAAGAVDYIHKPVSPSLVIARIQNHLSLRRAVREARAHEAEARRLLDVLMPPSVARELHESGTVKPQVHDHVGVLFADLVGFTRWCNQCTAEEVVAGLQEVMLVLEDIAASHCVEKLKTIGDAFMAATGLLDADPNAFERLVHCGLEMAAAVEAMPNDWTLRVGVHQGPVVAGIIGRRRFRFDVWGDTVNQASRLCDQARPGHVCVLAEAWKQPGRLGGAEEDVVVHGLGNITVLHLIASGSS